MPPLASNVMLFLLNAKASRICAGSMLSRRITSMPSISTNARACSKSSASPSIRTPAPAPNHQPPLQYERLAVPCEAAEFGLQNRQALRELQDGCPLRGPYQT